MTSTVSLLEWSDFDAMCEAWRSDGWGAEYRQLGKGAFHGSLLHVVDGSSVIYRGRWTPGIQHQGLQPKGTLTLTPTLFQQGPQRFNGEPMGLDQLIVQGGDADFELIGGPMWDAAVFQLPEVEVAQQLADITQRDPEAILRLQGLAALAPETSARLRRACLAYFEVVEQSVASGSAKLPISDMTEALIRLVVSAVAESQFGPHPNPHLSRCREIVRKTEDYVAACQDAPPRIADVCREVGVSERSLRYAFRDLVGVSPAAYLKTQRLNRVHQTLRVSEPSDTMVKEVAYANGFWHLGQFGRDYKALFGEGPSQTLAR